MNISRRALLGTPAAVMAAKPSVLENGILAVEFDRNSASIIAVTNKLTGERYVVNGDEFRIEAAEFEVEFHAARIVSVDRSPRCIRVRYRHPAMDLHVEYFLGDSLNFVEKKITLVPHAACGILRVALSQPQFSADGLKLFCYRHPTYDRIQKQHHGRTKRAPDTEPVRTFFGRTPKGGFFTGVEMPFDSSSQTGHRLLLGYSPSLKLSAGATLECEPMYVGVYKRKSQDAHGADWKPGDQPVTGVLPLPSESEAMVAMTSAILGARRNPELVAMACGWHCEMEQHVFTDESVEGDKRSVDFLAECGIDWLTDSHPWAGETEKMNALRDGDNYEPGPRARAFLEYARQAGVKVVQWPSMNNTHPWSREGRPFWRQKKEWLRIPVSRPGSSRNDFRNQPSNCIANTPFFRWLERICLQAMESGLYDGWCMDGDFWGWGGYFNSTIPVECISSYHDHLAPDSNYASQRALDRLVAAVRTRQQNVFVVMCRPPMDLGVWSQKNVDACFTLIETGSGMSNIAGGDEIRVASRIRVHHHFFPHYIDLPLLFPSYSGIPGRNNVKKDRPWPSEKLDYILLSALSCAPNLLLYLPTKSGIPKRDKTEIRKWLNWGRKNIAYLRVRKDLPDWPGPGRVDGSAHIVKDRGLIFLFNPNSQPRSIEFALTPEAIGVSRPSRYHIWQEHPSSDRRTERKLGDSVEWEVPAQTAVVLGLAPLV